MPVTRKPKARTDQAPAGAVDVEALIAKGGSVASEKPNEHKQAVPVILRLPSDLLRRIDSAVRARHVRIPRHTWLLEAVVEKLESDTNE
jgi:hypothetical protein